MSSLTTRNNRRTRSLLIAAGLFLFLLVLNLKEGARETSSFTSTSKEIDHVQRFPDHQVSTPLTITIESHTEQFDGRNRYVGDNKTREIDEQPNSPAKRKNPSAIMDGAGPNSGRNETFTNKDAADFNEMDEKEQSQTGDGVVDSFKSSDNVFEALQKGSYTIVSGAKTSVASNRSPASSVSDDDDKDSNSTVLSRARSSDDTTTEDEDAPKNPRNGRLRRPIHTTTDPLVDDVSNVTTSFYRNSSEATSAAITNQTLAAHPNENKTSPSCAILLYGLPRNFRDLTLPSLIKNVIPVNPTCHYFVHYYDMTGSIMVGEREDAGRRGVVNSRQVLLLEDAVHQYGSNASIVRFHKETDADFFERYASFLTKLQTETMDVGVKDGAINNKVLKYWPYARSEDFTNKTVTNIVKMWHSQSSVWNLMKKESTNKTYDTVAMLRSDVLFVSKLNVTGVLPETLKNDNSQPSVVIPDFANFPVNDRMIYGDAKGVEVWAARRFELLDQHAKTIAQKEPGQGIHDEKFLHYTIFPAIKALNISIKKDPAICFLRVRPDYAVRFQDCGNEKAVGGRGDLNHRFVEAILQRHCFRNDTIPFAPITLECGDEYNGPNASKTFPKSMWI